MIDEALLLIVKPPLRQAACGLAFFFALGGTALAGSFQVSPVNPTLSARQPVAALTVRNTGSSPTIIQLEAVAWSQPDGRDTYLPAPEILATPPIFTLPAGGTQVVRVGLRRSPDGSGEHAYRLFLREVPPPPKPGFQGLRMSLRISLPLFVQSAATLAPQLQWQATRVDPGHIRIRVTNVGQGHARLSGIRLTASGNDKPLPLPNQTVYVLAGTAHDWRVVSSAAIGATLHLVAQADAGPLRAELVVAGQ